MNGNDYDELVTRARFWARINNAFAIFLLIALVGGGGLCELTLAVMFIAVSKWAWAVIALAGVVASGVCLWWNLFEE